MLLKNPRSVTHLHVFLRVFEVGKKSVVGPDHSRLFVGGGIRISVLLAGLVSEKAIEIGTLLVGSSLFDGVALGALGLEDLGSLLFVSSLFLSHFDLFQMMCCDTNLSECEMKTSDVERNVHFQ